MKEKQYDTTGNVQGRVTRTFKSVPKTGIKNPFNELFNRVKRCFDQKIKQKHDSII